MQVARELDWLYAETGAQIATCVGGMDYRTEKRALDRGAHIVVGTPGRLRDHIDRGSLDLSGLRAAVLDEADEMLDLGFREDLEFILAAAPAERRTMMFSATVPPAIAALAKDFQRDALRIQTQGEARQHVDIEYRALNVSSRDREHAIFNVLRYLRGAHGHRVLQDAGEREPPVRPDGQPGVPGGGAVGRAVASRNAPTRCNPCATGVRGSASRPTWPRAGSTCRGWIW